MTDKTITEDALASKSQFIENTFYFFFFYHILIFSPQGYIFYCKLKKKFLKFKKMHQSNTRVHCRGIPVLLFVWHCETVILWQQHGTSILLISKFFTQIKNISHVEDVLGFRYNVNFLIWSYIDIDIDIEMLPNYVVLLSPKAAVQFPSLPPDHMISLWESLPEQ